MKKQTLASEFLSNFNGKVDRGKKKIDAYLGDPNDPDRVHDLRTALRKLEVSYEILPKKIRSKSIKQMKRFKKLFKENSKIRDYDVITSRITVDQTGKYDELVSMFKAKRQKVLKRATNLAKSAKNSSEHLNPKKIKIADAKISSRFDKVLTRLVDTISRKIPVVLSSEKKINELHELRKDCKRLRYVLEDAPSQLKKASEGEVWALLFDRSAGQEGGRSKSTAATTPPKTNQVENRLKELQDILGGIHDSDIIVEYLAGLKAKYNVKQVLEDERKKRSELYQKLHGYFKQAPPALVVSS